MRGGSLSAISLNEVIAVEEGSKILFLKVRDWGAIRESYKHEGKPSPFHYSADLVMTSMI
ncbi:hypothetical protein [Neochlamydia sp. AcF65]|uniref:hypothetical protein n=1 Tax=Neochlamydia sp. AcF65 TaxID=2795735 RepID=UPI001BC96590|nr:hypothetical protein [Neochlamydia sp. AcF65]